MLLGCDPLRLFIYKEGLARFATEKYVGPYGNNLSNLYMHLTNYAINKNSPNFVFNNSSEQDNKGHKRSLTSVFTYLKTQGHDTEALWNEIMEIITKTVVTVQPHLTHLYRSCQPEDLEN